MTQNKRRFQEAIREHWGIILITLLAAIFRFAFFDLTQYDVDYAFPGYQAMRILEKGEFPLASINNPIGFRNPPLMSYIQVLPLLLARSPLAIQGFITLLNLVAVPLTYFLGLRLFEKKTALAAAFFYAISPWAAYFSRGAWVQGLLPFFNGMVTYLLFPALLSKNREGGKILAAIIFASLMALTYVLSFAIFAQLAILLLVFRQRVSWRPLAAGSVFLAILSLPYIYSAIISNPTQEFGDVGQFFAGPWAADLGALGHALRLVSGADFSISLIPPQIPDYGWRTHLYQLSELGITLLVGLGIAEGIYLVWKKRKEAGSYLLTLLWFFIPVAMMTIHPRPVNPHYLLLTFPAGFLLAGLGTARLWQLRRWLLVLALGLTFLFGERLALTWQAIAEHPNIRRIEWLPLRYGLPIGEVMRDTARQLGIKEDVEFVYVTHAPQSWSSMMSGILVKTYAPYDHRRFLVLRVNLPALYVLMDPDKLSPAFSFARELVEKRIALPHDGSIRFFLFPALSPEQQALLPSNPLNLKLDIGWRLLGYDLPKTATPGTQQPFTTYWLVEDLPPNHNRLYFKPFVHLQDKEGEILVVSDGRGQAGSLWRKGQVFIDTSQISIPSDLPRGDYWISIGLYNPNTSRRAVFSTGQDHLLLGPIRIE